MKFREILDAAGIKDGRGQVDIPADWAQGRATFGGLGAALLAQTLRSVVPEERSLRSIMLSFIGPAEPQASDLLAEVIPRVVRRPTGEPR